MLRLLFLHTCTYAYMYGYILSLSLCTDSAATHPGHHAGPRGGVASLRLSRRRSLSHSRHLSHSGEGTLCMCAVKYSVVSSYKESRNNKPIYGSMLPNLSPSPNLYKVQSVYNNNVACDPYMRN